MIHLTNFVTKVQKKAQLSRLAAYCFAFMFVAPLFVISCDKDDPEPVYDNLKVDTRKMDLKTGETATFNIEAGSGSYEVKTSNDKIAQATLNDKVVSVTAQEEEGVAKISVIDTKTKQRKRVTVNITMRIPDLAVKADKTEVFVGEKITVAITAGSGKYKTEGDEFVSATLGSNAVTVKGLKKGKGKVVITDLETKQTQELEISVSVKLAVRVNATTVNVGEQTTIDITAGSGKYKITANEFVKATLQDAVITVEGVKIGEGEVTILDEETKQQKVVKIAVTEKVADLAIKVDKTLIKVDESAIVEITSGSGNYDVETNDFLKAELNGNKVTLTGLAEGIGVANITDTKTDQVKQVKIAVVPKVQASIVVVTAKAKGDDIKFKVDAEEEYQTAVWIDLNDNQQKDAGEEITKFNTYLNYKVDAQKVTIYGKVKYLSASYGNFTSIDASKNQSLETLYCFNNKLKELDLSKNPNLLVLGCFDSEIETLNLSNNAKLEKLYCDKNKLTELNLSSCTNLKELTCTKNTLSSLDVSSCTKLEKLLLNNNNLQTLDVSKCALLKKIFIDNNKLTSLNVKNCIELKELYCTGNELTELDVTSNTKLDELVCYQNKLTALDVSKNEALTYLAIHTNMIKAAAMENLVNSLPRRTVGDYAKFRVVNGKVDKRTNECGKSLVDIAKNKTWSVQDSNGKKYTGE